jgi:hypothetical protein
MTRQGCSFESWVLCLQIMLEDSELQHSIMSAHGQALSHVLSQTNRLDAPVAQLACHKADALSVADWLSTMGTQLLEACGGFVSADLSSTAISSCIQQVSSSLSQLSVSPQTCSESVDVSKPCVAEMMLAVSPVQSLCNSLEELLDRFPEQPMLEKLHSICSRILGAFLQSVVSL